MRTGMWVAVVAALGLAAGCAVAGRKAGASFIEYPLPKNRYVVVVVQEGGISEQEARREGLKRAAEVTREQEMRYFRVVKEEEVEVVKGGSSGGMGVYQNLYQEKIIEEDFGRRMLERRGEAESASEMYPALRFVIEMSQEPFTGRRGYDACDLTDC